MKNGSSRLNHPSFDQIKSLMDRMDACIFFSDPATREVLYANEKMQIDFDCHDWQGKRCFEVSHRIGEAPCGTCPCANLRSPDDPPIVNYILSDRNGHYYRHIDSMVELIPGRVAYMHYFFDVTDLMEQAKDLQEQVGMQELLKNISLGFAGCLDYESIMDQTLKMLGEFLEASAVGVMKYEEDLPGYRLSYCWPPEIMQAGDFSISENSIPHALRDRIRSNPADIFNTTDVSVPDALLQKLLDVGKTKSWIAAPIMPESGLFGTLFVAHQAEGYVWTQEEKYLMQAVCGIIAAGADRKRLDQEYLLAKQALFDVIDNVPSCIYWKDLKACYRGCNKLFADNVGLSIFDIVGKTDEELAALCKPGAITDVIMCRAMRHEDKDEVISLANGSGEEERFFAGRRIHIMNARGERASVLGVFSDVTEKVRTDREMEERDHQLREALDVAEASGKAKTDFLSRMSHEIRTPMNAIIGMSHIAASTDDVSKIKTCISKIDSASGQLLSIINDILDMSKIESGKMEIANEPFDLEKTLIETCNVVSVKADEKKQNLQFDIGRDIPSKLRGDEFRLSQVITNLISNAVKFTPENGDITIRVRNLGEIAARARLEFSICDSGIGISKENQKKLFGAFEQINGTHTRQYGGTGLGLAICKRIVDLMGGEIRVESEEGHGSIFSFEVDFEVVEKTSRASLLLGTNFKDLRILFVDDSEETRTYFENLMREYRVKTDCADSGEAGLALFSEAKKRNEPYSIVFVDYRMPGMDGVETARRIKGIYGENTIVILISIAEWSSIEEEASRAGIEKFLPKPLFPSQIVNTINEILGATPRKKVENKEKKYPDLAGKKILVAEDVEVNRDIVLALLEPTKATVAFAEDGKIAVEMVAQNPDDWDLILMDVYMPVMDGYASTKTIRKLNHPKAKIIPIVAMTANVFTEDVAECLNAGMNGHIGKPVDEEALMQKLAHYLLQSGEKPRTDRPVAPKPLQPSAPTGYQQYLPYIDVAEGLTRVRDNKKLFATMLKSYRTGTVYDDLIRAAEERDIAKTQYCAHTLKGVAGNLSLKKLFELIAPFENQLKSNLLQKDVLPGLKEALEETNKRIDQLLQDWEQEGM